MKSSREINRLLSHKKLDVESLFPSIYEITENLGVDLMLCIDQCYGGASVMSEELKRVPFFIPKFVAQGMIKYFIC